MDVLYEFGEDIGVIVVGVELVGGVSVLESDVVVDEIEDVFIVVQFVSIEEVRKDPFKLPLALDRVRSNLVTDRIEGWVTCLDVSESGVDLRDGHLSDRDRVHGVWYWCWVLVGYS